MCLSTLLFLSSPSSFYIHCHNTLSFILSLLSSSLKPLPPFFSHSLLSSLINLPLHLFLPSVPLSLPLNISYFLSSSLTPFHFSPPLHLHLFTSFFHLLPLPLSLLFIPLLPHSSTSPPLSSISSLSLSFLFIPLLPHSSTSPSRPPYFFHSRSRPPFPSFVSRSFSLSIPLSHFHFSSTLPPFPLPVSFPPLYPKFPLSLPFLSPPPFHSSDTSTSLTPPPLSHPPTHLPPSLAHTSTSPPPSLLLHIPPSLTPPSHPYPSPPPYPSLPSSAHPSTSLHSPTHLLPLLPTPPPSLHLPPSLPLPSIPLPPSPPKASVGGSAVSRCGLNRHRVRVLSRTPSIRCANQANLPTSASQETGQQTRRENECQRGEVPKRRECRDEAGKLTEIFVQVVDERRQRASASVSEPTRRAFRFVFVSGSGGGFRDVKGSFQFWARVVTPAENFLIWGTKGIPWLVRFAGTALTQTITRLDLALKQDGGVEFLLEEDFSNKKLELLLGQGLKQDSGDYGVFLGGLTNKRNVEFLRDSQKPRGMVEFSQNKKGQSGGILV
ncbi:hypothetical protein C7M84_001142 [Penaeus vannamei]|uniref:Uncharacterized protein n=1 Tax=Penaeus vannamei TaxID=6689 RepID=A0A3R7PXE5_PENVA|nr:hypothetical protein C7M84_001142 [Penaeus vannamei]